MDELGCLVDDSYCLVCWEGVGIQQIDIDDLQRRVWIYAYVLTSLCSTQSAAEQAGLSPALICTKADSVVRVAHLAWSHSDSWGGTVH